MRNAALPYVLVLSAFAAATLLACGSDSPPETPAGATFASCKAIVDACHDVDEGVGPVHECHDLSHEATTDEACAARDTSFDEALERMSKAAAKFDPGKIKMDDLAKSGGAPDEGD